MRRLGATMCLALAPLLSDAAWSQEAASQEAASQAAAEPQERAALGPLLPEEGLLETETWISLARRLLENLVDWIPRLFAAILVLVFFFVLSRVAARLMIGILRRTKADKALEQIFGALLKYVILGLGFIMAASQAGLQVGSLLAGVGVAGLAVGLAAQDSLSNLVAGLTILWDRPFRIGDNVTIADTFGTVQEIGLRTTRVRTVQRLDMLVPNRQVIENAIVNHTRTPELRLDIPLGIAYHEDSREARKVLLAAVEQSDRITSSPAPEVMMTELADSSVNLELRVFLRDPRQERRAFCELLELSKIALDEAGIEIPFPQRTLHLAEKSAALRLMTS